MPGREYRYLSLRAGQGWREMRPGAFITVGTVFTYGETGFWIITSCTGESLWAKNILTGKKRWLPSSLVRGITIVDVKLDGSDAVVAGDEEGGGF